MTAMKLLLMLLGCVLQCPNNTHAVAFYGHRLVARDNDLLFDVKPNMDLDSYTSMEADLLPMLHPDVSDEEPPGYKFLVVPSDKPSIFKTMIKMVVHSNYPLAQIQQDSEPLVEQSDINYQTLITPHSERMSQRQGSPYFGRMSQRQTTPNIAKMIKRQNLAYSGRLSRRQGTPYGGKMIKRQNVAYSGRLSRRQGTPYGGKMIKRQDVAHSGRMAQKQKPLFSERMNAITSPFYMDPNNLQEEQEAYLNYQPQVFQPYFQPQMQPYFQNWNPLPLPAPLGWNPFSTPDGWNPFPKPDVWNPFPTPDVWNPFPTPDVWNPIKEPDFSIHSNFSNGEGSLTGTGDITGSIDESDGIISVEGNLVGGGQISGSVGGSAMKNPSSTEEISGSINESSETINSESDHDDAGGISDASAIPVEPSTDNVNLNESNDTDIMKPFQIDGPADIGWNPFSTPNIGGSNIWNYEPAEMDMFGENFWNHKNFRKVN